METNYSFIVEVNGDRVYSCFDMGQVRAYVKQHNITKYNVLFNRSTTKLIEENK